MYLSLHSYGQYWLTPYSYDLKSYPSDYQELEQLAETAAAKCQRYYYTVGHSADLLYPASGIITNGISSKPIAKVTDGHLCYRQAAR